MAASVSIASASRRKSPRPIARSFWFCANIQPALRTFVAEVAKWLCQQKVNFSPKGCRTATIRRTHHPASSCSWSRSCLLRAFRAALSAVFATRGITWKVGGGVATAPASFAGSASRIIARYPAVPIAATASMVAPVPPNPVRRTSLAAAAQVVGSPDTPDLVCGKVFTPRECPANVQIGSRPDAGPVRDGFTTNGGRQASLLRRKAAAAATAAIT